MRAEVARLSPGDVAGYERFLSASEAIFRIGFEQLGHVPFGSWTDMARMLPDLIRLAGHRSRLWPRLAAMSSDPRLRVVLSFHPLLVGGNPFATTSIYSLIAFLERRWGVHFAMGGTGPLVRGLVGLIEGQGGPCGCDAEVAEILVTNGRAAGVRLAVGRGDRGRRRRLQRRQRLDLSASGGADDRRRWTDRRIEKARYSMSLFVWYFGTKRPYPDVAHHTILLGPRYRELLDDIFDRKVLADGLQPLSPPPDRDRPVAGAAGCDAFYVLSPVPHLDSGTDWARMAEEYRQQDRAASRARPLLPGLEREIVTSRM